MSNIIKAYNYSDKNKVVSFYVDIDEFEDKCITCKEKLDQELGCINCFCIQYWAYDKKDLPTDIQDLREKDIFKPTINIQREEEE